MEKIYVAKLGKSIGLKGQMKIYIESDFPEQFKKGASFITSKNKTLTVEFINNTYDTVKFLGIDTIDDAKVFINSLLYTTKEESKKNCKLEKKQFFWFEIEGCSIFENGVLLGKVIEINRYPTDDYMTVETEKSIISQDPKTAKNFLLPYNDNYIIDTNIENKTIHIKHGFDILAAS